MKKVLVFAGSNSKNSINKVLAVYAASQLDNAQLEILDLNDFTLPIYNPEYEINNGIPNNAIVFLDKIKMSNGIILSLAEHNGAYAAVFKNMFDWMSRIDGKLWSNVPMLLMATSNGKRGGASVLEIARNRFKHNGGNIKAVFSLPSFDKNFINNRIIDEYLLQKMTSAIKKLQKAL